MRVLSGLGSLIIVIAALGVGIPHVVAHPPTTPDHGVNGSTFHALWSGDDDRGIASSAPSMQTLAAGTDIPFDSPPAAVERWNRADHREFPRSGPNASLHPADATLSDGQYLRDVYVEIFAVQPSTYARLSGTDQPLYVAPNSSILGTVDYRIDVPADNITPQRQVHWSLDSHRIVETRLRVDGQVVSTTNGTSTPRLSHSELSAGFGHNHTFTLESEVEAGLQKRVRTCQDYNTTRGCLAWQSTVEVLHENTTVRDAVAVRTYDLEISGFRAQYPDGDWGLVVFKSHPWLGYSVPGGEVRGVWRFYTARDESWDTLVRSTADGRSERHSPLHPLQVFAYPIETGPTASPRESVSVLDVDGVNMTPPTLPEQVQLDVLTDPYTASYGIATRTETANYSLAAVEAQGLVRGVSVDAEPAFFSEVPIKESTLTLDIVEQSAQSVTVEVTLVEAATGAPISTVDRDGVIHIAGTRVETGRDGTVTVTLQHPPSGVSARYEPGQWWRNIPGYTPASDVVYVRGTVIQFVEILYELGVPISLFLLGVFLIDRITGWRLWPPWRWL